VANDDPPITTGTPTTGAVSATQDEDLFDDPGEA
jgi:hypothetical protein